MQIQIDRVRGAGQYPESTTYQIEAENHLVNTRSCRENALVRALENYVHCLIVSLQSALFVAERERLGGKHRTWSERWGWSTQIRTTILRPSFVMIETTLSFHSDSPAILGSLLLNDGAETCQSFSPSLSFSCRVPAFRSGTVSDPHS